MIPTPPSSHHLWRGITRYLSVESIKTIADRHTLLRQDFVISPSGTYRWLLKRTGAARGRVHPIYSKAFGIPFTDPTYLFISPTTTSTFSTLSRQLSIGLHATPHKRFVWRRHLLSDPKNSPCDRKASNSQLITLCKRPSRSSPSGLCYPSPQSKVYSF